MCQDAARRWAEPGTFEVADGVHRIPLALPQDGLLAVNVYVVESPSGPVLIDAGSASGPGQAQLGAGLRSLGYELGDIARIVVTHLHYDHYTLAVPLRRAFGIPIGLPSGERSTLDAMHAPTTQTLTRQMRQLRAHGASELAASIEAAGWVHDIDRSAWDGPDEWIVPGSTIHTGGRRLTAVATPGHTRGHCAFADLDNRLLFAGDHVLPHITPSIGFEAIGSRSPLVDFLASLRRIAGLPDMTLLPAHGSTGASTHNRVEELLRHHDDRLARTMAAVAAGAGSAHEVANSLPWTRREQAFTQLDDFNRMLAIAETVAHLEALVDLGDVEAVTSNATRRYRLPGSHKAVDAPARSMVYRLLLSGS